jgi:hypothetical protein
VIFRLLRYSLSLVGFLAIMALVVVIAAAALLLAGGAEIEGCEASAGGEPVPVERSATLAAQVQARLEAFAASLDAGAPATVSVSGDETSSRIAAYLAEEGVVVEDVVVCFEPERARVSARIADLLGQDLSVQMEGSLDLSGEAPRLALTEIRAGKLPLVGPVRDLITDRINEALAAIELRHRLDLSFDYGVATLSGEPGRP